MNILRFFIVLSIFLLNGFVIANDGTATFHGIEKISHKWHKLTHHKTRLMLIKDCESISETVKVFQRGDKYFLNHQSFNGKQVYEILSYSEIKNKHHLIGIDLKNTKTNAVKHTKVKIGKHRSIWYGLSALGSTDVFIKDRHKHHYDSIRIDCK